MPEDSPCPKCGSPRTLERDAYRAGGVRWRCRPCAYAKKNAWAEESGYNASRRQIGPPKPSGRRRTPVEDLPTPADCPTCGAERHRQASGQIRCNPCHARRKQERKDASGLTWTEFEPSKGARRRGSRKWQKLGITQEQYQAMHDAQGGVCAICKGHETKRRADGEIQALSADHDHRCHPGSKMCPACFRGLLCHNDNIAVGHADDDPLRLVAAAIYLAPELEPLRAMAKELLGPSLGLAC